MAATRRSFFAWIAGAAASVPAVAAAAKAAPAVPKTTVRIGLPTGSFRKLSPSPIDEIAEMLAEPNEILDDLIQTEPRGEYITFADWAKKLESLEP